MTRDDGGADHGTPGWFARCALGVAGLCVGAAACVGAARISWRLLFATLPAAVGLLLYSASRTGRPRDLRWRCFLVGVAVGHALGSAFLLWVASVYSAAY